MEDYDTADDRDFAQDPVSTQGSDDDYHSGSISSGRQISAATLDTVKEVLLWSLSSPLVSVVLLDQRRRTQPEVHSDNLLKKWSMTACPCVSMRVSRVQEGMLVVGGPYTRRDIFKPVPHDEPPPEPLENLPQPSPEETDSSQPLPPDPTPPQSQHPEVSPLQLQENYPPSPPPPPPPLLSSEIEEKVSTPLKKRQYLDPPGPPLSAVGDLKVDAKKASSVTISWSAPFSLDVTGVDPDIWEKTNVTFMTSSDPTSEFCSSWRVTPDVVDDRVIEEPPSPEGPVVTYQLRADNRYSFLVSLPNTTDEVAPPRINFTTYDVQSAAANTTKGTNNKINLTGEFIKDTTAQGCFVVLQCEYGNPDVFRVVLLPDDSSTSVESTIHDILSSTYNMLVYDLEEDELRSRHPAVEQSTNVTVMGNGPIADAESQFLNNGSLDVNGVTVNVRCEFKEGIEGASCVLVYREYGNKTLVVEEYPQNTVFPVTLTIDGDLFILWKQIVNCYWSVSYCCIVYHRCHLGCSCTDFVEEGVQPPIPEDTRVQYTEIDTRTTHKMARSPYADLGPLPTNRPKPPKIETKTQGPYVEFYLLPLLL
ncbi:hypothetical protein GBAR_LOCUS21502 [Geodia barretti]|uniref:Uncharacterized protein n=1 Tax=Geodia barretti TaxID=519541 RepID=A0AA35WYG8_GEOBA|nr:hypothetical protein GBAR_LOCUS21502 [Geodia barretti]